MVFTASLLGAQHKKGIVRKTNRKACLLCLWARHLTGRLHLYVADRWHIRTSPGYNYKATHPAVVKGDSWVPISGDPPFWWWDYQSFVAGLK